MRQNTKKWGYKGPGEGSGQGADKRQRASGVRNYEPMAQGCVASERSRIGGLRRLGNMSGRPMRREIQRFMEP